MEALVGVFVFLLTLFLGMPIFLSFFVAALAMLGLMGSAIDFIPLTIFDNISKDYIVAILFYILAGDLLSMTGMADQLVLAADAITGRMRGGLGATVVVASGFFGALTGSTMATAAAIGSVMIVRMEKYGYDRRYSSAVVAISSPLGNLIPPSVCAIIYAFLTRQSVAALFLALMAPGLLLIGGNILVNHFISRQWIKPVPLEQGIVRTPKIEGAGRTKALRFSRSVLPALLVPFIILGGIYGGVFTPTEAGAVACFYALFAGVFIYRVRLRSLVSAVVQSAITIGVLLVLLALSMVFTRVLVTLDVPQALTKAIIGLSDNVYVIWALVNLLLLIAGMFMDSVPPLIIMTPLLVPLFQGADINLIHAGTVIIFNTLLGGVTPPLATVLYLTARIGNIRFDELVRPLMPFLFFSAIPILLVVTYVPALSLWLPSLVLGKRIVFGG